MTSVLVSLPSVFFQAEFEPVRSVCVGPRDSNIDLALKIYLILHTAMLLIQSVVMVFCYGSLIRGLYFANTVCPETETTDGERRSEKKKLVITLLLATVGFLIGYVPSMVLVVVAFQTNANIRVSSCTLISRTRFSFCLTAVFVYALATLFEVPTLERDSDAEQVVGSQHHRMTTFSDSDPFFFSSPNVNSKKS